MAAVTKKIVEQARDRLFAGERGSSVYSWLEDEVGVERGVRAVTSVRESLFASPHPAVVSPTTNLVERLKSMAATREARRDELVSKIGLFESGTLRYQHQARFDAKRRRYFEDGDMDALLAASTTFIESVESFRPSTAAYSVVTNNYFEQVRNKTESKKSVTDFEDLLQGFKNYMQLAIDENEFVKISVPRLAICLLLVSGRRCNEILSGEARFSRGSTPMSVVFEGQSKRHGTIATEAFEIPLLCQTTKFLAAYAALRKLQKFIKIDSDVVNQKYSSTLRHWIKQLIVTVMERENTKVTVSLSPHELRSLYCSAVYQKFEYWDSGLSFTGLLRKILGHKSHNNVSTYDFVHAETELIFPRAMRPLLA